MNHLDINIFEDTLFAARHLLGKLLVVKQDDGILVGGVIVETEAYLECDPGSHTFRGRTERNKDMYLDCGHIYVYLIYGMYYCLNFVTAREGIGEAVLIRALKPTMGIDRMQFNRKRSDLKDLCSGPGKLTQALCIDNTYSGSRLFQSGISVYNDNMDCGEVIVSNRIGLSNGSDLPYRFYLEKEKAYVSRL